MRYFLMFLISFAVFFLIDMIWLNIIAKDLYQRELGYLMAERFNVLAAMIFYLLFVAGLLFFVIHPALLRDSWTYAIWAGAFFGLVTYATYDLTNMATVKDWPMLITIIDLLWGTGLGAITSILSFLIIRKLF